MAVVKFLCLKVLLTAKIAGLSNGICLVYVDVSLVS